jgi:hypothetical protein
VNIDAAVKRIPVTMMCECEQLTTAQHFVWIFGERFEQIEFPAGD